FTGMLSIIGMLAIGSISDRLGRRQTAALSYLSTIMGILSLMLVSVWPSLALVYGFVVFFGLMQGVRGPIIVAMVAVLFRGGGVGAIYGTLSLAMGLGAALGSWCSALIFAWSGSYLASFALAIAAAPAGPPPPFFLSRPRAEPGAPWGGGGRGAPAAVVGVKIPGSRRRPEYSWWPHQKSSAAAG